MRGIFPQSCKLMRKKKERKNQRKGGLIVQGRQRAENKSQRELKVWKNGKRQIKPCSQWEEHVLCRWWVFSVCTVDCLGLGGIQCLGAGYDGQSGAWKAWRDCQRQAGDLRGLFNSHMLVFLLFMSVHFSLSFQIIRKFFENKENSRVLLLTRTVSTL